MADFGFWLTAAAAAEWASMPTTYNSRVHCYTLCHVCCDSPTRPIAADAIDESSAECHPPNYFGVGSSLWRSAFAVFYHSAFCSGHCCCHSSNRLPWSASWSLLWRRPDRSLFDCPAWYRWRRSAMAQHDRRKRFGSMAHRWLAIHRVDCDTIDFHPTASERKRVSQRIESKLICCRTHVFWKFDAVRREFSGNLRVPHHGVLVLLRIAGKAARPPKMTEKSTRSPQLNCVFCTFHASNFVQNWQLSQLIQNSRNFPSTPTKTHISTNRLKANRVVEVLLSAVVELTFVCLNSLDCVCMCVWERTRR